MGVQVALSGVKKAAIFIAALGEDASSKVFKHLHDSEIEMVARELSALGAVPPEVAGVGSAINNAVARIAGLVTTATALWRNQIVVPGGEIKPGVRSPQVWSATRP